VNRFVSLQFLNLRQLVGLLGWDISPSQGRYLTQTQNKHRHPCLEWDSTHDPSVRAGEGSSWLRPSGRCDRQIPQRCRYPLVLFSRPFSLLFVYTSHQPTFSRKGGNNPRWSHEVIQAKTRPILVKRVTALNYTILQVGLQSASHSCSGTVLCGL
jgi:hypothetical protein